MSKIKTLPSGSVFYNVFIVQSVYLSVLKSARANVFGPV